jgi:pimeloyl-[acyl-carrier protein] methyl ester esterase
VSSAAARRIKLVLLPGLDGTGVQFRPLLRALPAHIEPLVLSYPQDQALGYDALCEHVRRLLPVGDDYLLLGESFGGPLSIRLAAEKPRGLKGLVLCATFVKCPQAWVPPWFARWVPSWPFILFPKLAQAKAVLGGYATGELLALAKEALEMVPAAVMARRVGEVIDVDVGADLRCVEAPILYLRGRDDHVVPASSLKRIQALRPDIHVARIPAPHMVLQTQPQLAAEAIETFSAALN